MRSRTQRSTAPLFRELTTNWPAAAEQVSILGGMQIFLTRAVLAETRNFPARRWHVLAQLAGWYLRGD
jgi:hypothetical protein